MILMHDGHVKIVLVEMHCRHCDEGYAFLFDNHYCMLEVNMFLLEYVANEHDMFYTTYECYDGS